MRLDIGLSFLLQMCCASGDRGRAGNSSPRAVPHRRPAREPRPHVRKRDLGRLTMVTDSSTARRSPRRPLGGDDHLPARRGAVGGSSKDVDSGRTGLGSRVVLGNPVNGGCGAGVKGSDVYGGAADAAGLELPALPACDRDEEHRELLELPDPLPPRGVVAARAGPGLPGAEVLLLGAETEEEEHRASVGSTSQRTGHRYGHRRPRGPAPHT